MFMLARLPPLVRVLALGVCAMLLVGCGTVRGVAGYGVKGVKRVAKPPESETTSRMPFP